MNDNNATKIKIMISTVREWQRNIGDLNKNISSYNSTLRALIFSYFKDKISAEYSHIADYLLEVDFETDCFDKKWKPKVKFTSLNACKLSSDGVWFQRTNTTMPFQFKKVDAPIDIQEFELFLAKANKELGILCSFERNPLEFERLNWSESCESSCRSH